LNRNKFGAGQATASTESIQVNCMDHADDETQHLSDEIASMTQTRLERHMLGSLATDEDEQKESSDSQDSLLLFSRPAARRETESSPYAAPQRPGSRRSASRQRSAALADRNKSGTGALSSEAEEDFHRYLLTGEEAGDSGEAHANSRPGLPWPGAHSSNGFKTLAFNNHARYIAQ